MPYKANCQLFDSQQGTCLHNAAPKFLFGKPMCVLAIQHPDLRLRGVCALQQPIPCKAPPRNPSGQGLTSAGNSNGNTAGCPDCERNAADRV